MPVFEERRQIKITLATGFTIFAFLVAPIVTYFSAQIAVAAKIADAQQATAVLQERTNSNQDRIMTIESRLNRIEDKLDALLYANGIDPRKLPAQ